MQYSPYLTLFSFLIRPMNIRKLFFFNLCLFCCFSSLAQLPVAYYDFEDNGNRNTTVETTTETAISTIGAPSVTINSLTSSHNTGNGLSYTGSNTGFAIGYYGFSTSGTSAATLPNVQFGPFDFTGLSTITLSADLMGIGAQMPNNVRVYWSNDNVTYNLVNVVTTITTSFTTRTFSLGSGANNSSSIYIRIVGYNAGASPTSSDGVMLLDNFTIRATTITTSMSLLNTTNYGAGLSSGGALVAEIPSFTINDAAAVVNLVSDFTLNGRITLTNGELSLGNHTLTIQNSTTAPFARTNGTLTVNANSIIFFGTNTINISLPNNLFTASPANLSSLVVNIGIGNTVSLNNNPLILAGNLDVTSGTFTVNNASGTIVVAGNANVSGTINCTVASGLIQVLGNLNLTGATIGLTNTTAVLEVVGNITGTGTQTTGSTGRIRLTGSGTTIANTVTYDNVEINSLGNVSLTGNTTLTGLLTLTAGNLSVGAGNTLTLTTLTAQITKTSGFILMNATSNLVLGNGSDNNSVTIPASTFVTPTTFANLTINRGTGTISLGNNPITLTGDLTVQSGIFTVNNASGTVTVLGNAFVSGNLNCSVSLASITINGNLNLTAGTIGLTNTNATISVNGNVTGTGSQTVSSVGRLLMIGNGTTLSSNVIYDNVEINSAGNVSLTGNSIFNGVITLTTGNLVVGNNTLEFRTAGNQLARTAGFLTLSVGSSFNFTTGASFTIPNNTFNGSTTIASIRVARAETGASARSLTWGINPLSVTGNIDIISGTAATTFIVSSSGNITTNGNLNFSSGGGISTLTTTGNLTINGHINLLSGAARQNGGGRIIMTGNAGVANIAGIQLYTNVELNSANNFSLTGSAILAGALTLTNGILQVGSNSLTFHTSNTPIVKTGGTISLSSNSSLAFGITGSAAGNAFTIPNNSFTSAPTFSNFSMNRTNTLTLNNQNFSVTGLFNLEAGRLILPNNYLFTLKSTSITNTALVAPMGATSSILYNTGAAFKIERFVQNTGGVRAYRDIAPAINSGSTTIFDNWQEGGTTGLENGINYGSQITGVAGVSPGGVDVTTGLDRTQTGSASLFTNSISTINGNSSWITYTSTNQTNDTLSALKGYRIFIRGNRNHNLYQSPQPSTLSSAVILRSTGKIVTGDVVFTTSSVTANGASNTNIRLNSGSTTGYTMIGNPYQCIVDWNALFTDASTSNISATYTITDPNVGTTGGYATYNQVSGISVPMSSAISRYIQPGQAFFIQNNASTNPSITFKESHKSTNASNFTNTFRTANQGNLDKMFINLKRNITNVGYKIVDGVAVVYSETFSNSLAQDDSYKISNSADNLSIYSNSANLVIEGRTAPSVQDTIWLNLAQTGNNINYQLNFQSSFIANTALNAFLIDQYLSTETALNLNDEKNYNFTTTTNINTFNKRFYIVFRNNNVLPVSFINVTAQKQDDVVNIIWNTFESNTKEYFIEHSIYGIDFTTIETISAKGNSSSTQQQYQFLHKTPLVGTNFYRIKSVDVSNKETLSNIVSIKMNGTNNSISIYPNPVKNKQLNLQIANVKKGEYNLTLTANNGSIVYSTKIIIENNNTSIAKNIHLPEQLTSGIYIVNMSGNNFVHSEKVIVE